MKDKIDDLKVYLAFNTCLCIEKLYFFLLKKNLIHKDYIMEYKFKKTAELYQEYRRLR